MPKLQIELNGTGDHPYYAMTLEQNPFPQYERMAAVLHLQKLGGTPIPHVEYIREHLKGWPEEFVDMCCQKFIPGQFVKFTVWWNE